MTKDPIGIVLIVVGILFLIKPLMVWLITLQNKFRGTQTNITSVTLWYYRFVGVFIIVMGCIMFFGKN